MEEPPFRDRRDEFVLDPRQREIRDLLRLIGPEPTQFFTDACRIVNGAAGVTMQTHLAAHSLREIEGRLHDKVPHSTVMLGEFFSAARVEWFPLLREEGYFDNPPPLEIDEEGRVAYAEWPAARFLVRAAAVEELQDDVVEILSTLDTDN